MLHALCWSRQHQQLCHFSSPTIWLLFCPLLHLSFYLNLSGRSGRNCLLCSPVLSVYNGSPDTRFFWGTNAAEALLAPSAIPCSLSLLTSRIYSCLFSGWRPTVSSKFFDIQARWISTEELLLPCHALFRLRCNGHSVLLSSYLSRIGRNENPSCIPCGHPSLSSHSALFSCGSQD